MTKKSTTLNINLSNPTANTRVVLLQADTPEIILNLTTDGSTAFDLTGFTSLLTAAKDSFGWTAVGDHGTPTAGILTFSPTADNTAVPGNHRVSITVTDGTEVTTIYLGTFTVKNNPSATTPDESDQSALYVVDENSIIPEYVAGQVLGNDGTTMAWEAPGSTTWGGISGTLSDQTDLNSALASAAGSSAWGQIVGTLSDQTDLQSAQDTQDTAIGLNTAKVSYDDQAAVALNTAKISFDAVSSARLANTSGTNTGDQDISGIGDNATAIALNTSHRTGNGSDHTHVALNTTHRGLTDNPHSVTATQAGAEADLGNPTTDGHVLSSTIAGTRSWIAGGGGYTPSNSYALTHANAAGTALTETAGLRTDASGGLISSGGNYQSMTVESNSSYADYLLKNTTGQYSIRAGAFLGVRTPLGGDAIVIYNGAPDNTLLLRADGRVGLGLYNPSARLHVDAPTSNTVDLLNLSENGTDRFTIDSNGWGTIKSPAQAKMIIQSTGVNFATLQMFGNGINYDINCLTNGNLAFGGANYNSVQFYEAAPANSFIVDGSGNVGIGTGPSYKLDAYGATGNVYARVRTGDNSAAGIRLNNSVKELTSYVDSSGSYVFRDASLGRNMLSLSATGKAQFRGIASQTDDMISLLDSTGTDLLGVDSDGSIQMTGTNGIFWGDTGFYEGASNTLYAKVNGAVMSTYLASGFLMGAGQANRAYLPSAVSSSTVPVFAFSDDATKGMGGAAGEVSLITGGVEALRIDASQNVGIGATAPTYPLDVIRTNLASTYARIYNSNATAQTAGLKLKNSAHEWTQNVTGSGILQFNGTNGNIIYANHNAPSYSLMLLSDGRMVHRQVPSQTGDSFVIEDSTGTDLLTVDSSGSIQMTGTNGIFWGDTGIYEEFGNVITIKTGTFNRFKWAGNKYGSDSSAGAGLMNESSSTVNPTILPYNTNETTGMGGTSGTVSLITGGVEAVRIDASQNVGIGGTPLYKLDVQSSAASATTHRIRNSNVTPQTINFVMSNTAREFIWQVDSGGSLSLYNNTEYVYPMSIKSTNRIGLNISTPLARLHVNAPASNTDDLLNLSENGTDLLSVDSSGGLYWGDGDTGFFEGSDDNLYVKTGGSSRALYTSAGFFRANSSGYWLRDGTPTSTFPVIGPSIADLDTGIGTAGADQLSLITGGTEAVKITADQQMLANVPHGEMYEDSAGSTINITTAGTYYKWTTTTAGDCSGAGYVVHDAVADDLTVGASGGGVYEVSVGVSFSGSNSLEVTCAVHKNGSPLNNIKFIRKLGTGGDIGTARATGFVSLASTDTIDVRFTGAVSSKTVTVEACNLTMSRISS